MLPDSSATKYLTPLPFKLLTATEPVTIKLPEIIAEPVNGKGET